MPATPLRESLAFRETVALLTNHPFDPTEPETEADVVGGVESMATYADRIGSALPATSVAKKSIWCSPSDKTNGTRYSRHTP